MGRGRIALLKALVHAACLAPFALVAARAAELGGLTLGPNPVESLLLAMGTTALNMLLITLAVTPLRRLTGRNWLIRFRRMLGLYSFFYAAVHFLTYAALDLRFDLATLAVDFSERPYIMAGLAALLGLIALAVTSTRGMQRRLGRNWLRLHLLIYPIAILAVVHFYWQTRGTQPEPLIYGGVLAVLLGYRAVRRLGRRLPRSNVQ